MEYMKSFIAAIETDAEFNEEIHALLGDGKVAEVVEAAIRKGFTITEGGLQEYFEGRINELPEDELENVTGGSSGTGETDGTVNNPHISKTCWFLRRPLTETFCARLGCKKECNVEGVTAWYLCSCWGTSRCVNYRHHKDSACR